MFANVGIFDRLIRVALAAALLALGLTTYSGSSLGIGLSVAAVIVALTAAVSFCPLYRLLGIHTNNAPIQGDR
jgi:hypothetical protein